MGVKPNLDIILDSVRNSLRPAKDKLKEVDELVSKINTLLKKARLKAVCSAGGSYAKGVILKNDFDIDLFIRFDYSYKDKDISVLLEKALKSLKPVLVHGSRDYFQLKKKKVLYELIPVLKITNYKKAVNVTDMSPLHVDYANKKFNRVKNLRDEVRLAKQFCKAIKVYGAESYIRGFSGHVLDLLIIHYGGFEKLLMQAALWGHRVVVDLEHHLKNPLEQLNNSKLISPLVIVDPVQPDRNAAAAISKEKFEVFIIAAKKFLHKPSVDFFKMKPVDIGALKKQVGKNWIVMAKAKPYKGKDDVVYTKVLRLHEFFIRELGKAGFKLLGAGWEHGSTCLLYYVVQKEKLSNFIFQQGPPVGDKLNSIAFRNRHKHVMVKNGVLFARVNRKYKLPRALLKKLSAGPYAKSKIKSFSFS